MRRSSCDAGLCTPGVSTKTICAAGCVPFCAGTSTTPMMRLRVVCGLAVTMATFSPVSALSSVLLPTLGRPRMATNPDFTCAMRLLNEWYKGTAKLAGLAGLAELGCCELRTTNSELRTTNYELRTVFSASPARAFLLQSCGGRAAATRAPLCRETADSACAAISNSGTHQTSSSEVIQCWLSSRARFTGLE